MTAVNKEGVIEQLKGCKDDLRIIVEKYATQTSLLAVNSSDPHLPVVSLMQMALAQACVEYLITSGMDVTTAVNATIQATGKSMEAWVSQIAKLQKIQ